MISGAGRTIGKAAAKRVESRPVILAAVRSTIIAKVVAEMNLLKITVARLGALSVAEFLSYRLSPIQPLNVVIGPNGSEHSQRHRGGQRAEFPVAVHHEASCGETSRVVPALPSWFGRHVR